MAQTMGILCSMHDRTNDFNFNRRLHIHRNHRFETCSGVWYPRRRPCGVAINTLVDLNKLAGETPSFLITTSNCSSPEINFHLL